MGWSIEHADNSTVGLKGDIDGELYVQQYNMCYKLPNSLYGLKQFSLLWHENLRNFPKTFGFTPLKSCEFDFKFKDDTNEVINLVYLEDLLSLSPELTGVNEPMNSWKANSMYLVQLAYCSRILNQFGMETVETTSTLMVENSKAMRPGPGSTEG